MILSKFSPPPVGNEMASIRTIVERAAQTTVVRSPSAYGPAMPMRPEETLAIVAAACAGGSWVRAEAPLGFLQPFNFKL